jgi:protein-disulfide isomerase
VPAPPNIEGVKLDLRDKPIRGDTTAKITIVEFTDYQCVVCLRHARNTYPQIQKEYVETGKVKYSVIDLPLETMHPYAFKAAEATHCAEDQGKFWEMHDHLFENRMLADLSPHAKAIGLDIEKFKDCLASGRYEEGVRQDLALAAQAGAVRTPTFVIAATDPADPSKVEGIILIPGAREWPGFRRAIEQALAEVSN